MTPNDIEAKTPYLRHLLKTVEVLEKSYCVSLSSTERFYAWLQGQTPDLPLQFNYYGTNDPWHSSFSAQDAQTVAPVVLGIINVNAALTLAMWLEGYLRDMCRILYQHTQDGTWFLEPKLHRVDWKMVENVTKVSFADVLCHKTVERLFEIRDFSFNYTNGGVDPGLSRQDVLKMLADVKIFAIDFELAFFFAHTTLSAGMIGTGRDPRFKK